MKKRKRNEELMVVTFLHVNLFLFMHKLAAFQMRVPDESGEGEDDGDGAPGRLGDGPREAPAVRDEVVHGPYRDPLQRLHDHLSAAKIQWDILHCPFQRLHHYGHTESHDGS